MNRAVCHRAPETQTQYELRAMSVRAFATVLAWALAVAASSASAAELTPDERSELRERAQALQRQREQNPSWDGGTRRINEPQSTPPHSNKESRARKHKTATQRTGELVRKKVKRAVKNLPGALVSRR